MTTLANSCADALGYSVGAGLADDAGTAEVQAGGPAFVARVEPAGPLDQRPERIEVRAPRFDIRYVVRDFVYGAGMAEDFGTGSHGRIRRAGNPSTLAGSTFDESGTLDRGYVGRWDEGAAVPVAGFPVGVNGL